MVALPFWLQIKKLWHNAKYREVIGFISMAWTYVARTSRKVQNCIFDYQDFLKIPSDPGQAIALWRRYDLVVTTDKNLLPSCRSPGLKEHLADKDFNLANVGNRPVGKKVQTINYFQMCYTIVGGLVYTITRSLSSSNSVFFNPLSD